MFNQLRKNLISLFGISSVEANGVVILHVTLAFVVFGTLMLNEYNEMKYDSYLSDKSVLDSMLSLIVEDTSSKLDDSLNIQRPLNLAMFDPNFVSVSRLEDMGLPGYLARRIVRYRNAGGQFRTRKDVRRIYGMSDSLYNRLFAYIDLPDDAGILEPVETRMESRETPREERLTMDLNAVDSSDLVRVAGIGPFLAGRIIRYRKLLGGFVVKDQLKEIYGIREPGLTNLMNSVYIMENYSPHKIQVNFAAWKDLVHHPYISADAAGEIIRYRDAAGPLRSPEDLKRIKSLNDSIISKVTRYITF